MRSCLEWVQTVFLLYVRKHEWGFANKMQITSTVTPYLQILLNNGANLFGVQPAHCSVFNNVVRIQHSSILFIILLCFVLLVVRSSSAGVVTCDRLIGELQHLSYGDHVFDLISSDPNHTVRTNRRLEGEMIRHQLQQTMRWSQQAAGQTDRDPKQHSHARLFAPLIGCFQIAKAVRFAGDGVDTGEFGFGESIRRDDACVDQSTDPQVGFVSFRRSFERQRG